MAQPPKKAKKQKQKEHSGQIKDPANTEFPTDWDIDYYKTDYESEEHWELRKRFMETHKDKFPEDSLVCLAQVFVNMEFMGCKYPAATMQRVAELSKEIAKEFRAERAGRLKRTFVAASDAAEQRAKGRAKARQQQNQEKEQPATSEKRKCFGTGEWNSTIDYGKPNLNINLFDNLPYGKFILSFFGGCGFVRNSATRCKVEYKEVAEDELPQQKKISIYLNDQFVASASDNPNLAKAAATKEALKVLQRECYTIKQNPSCDVVKIEKSNNKIVLGVIKQHAPSSADGDKLDSNNKGYRMMKMMGWTGGGLGAKTQGREEPVSYLLKNNRGGLGNEASNLDHKYFEKLLTNYVNSPDIRELQFEPTFTKEERAILHQIANKFNLKSSSRGSGDNRRLLINKKHLTDKVILKEVLIDKNPIYCDRYLVQVPESKAQLFPEHTQVLTP